MKFLTRARGSDVENAPCLIGFAIAADAVDPDLDLAAFFAFGLRRRHEELGNFAGSVGLLETAFEP